MTHRPDALVLERDPYFSEAIVAQLRERGFTGELRAVGDFIRDQLHYLNRCGFNAFQLADEAQLVGALSSLDAFTEHYQAASDQPQPLFRRR